MRLNFPQKNNGMYILSTDQIEQIATAIINRYYPENLIHSTPLDTIHFMQEILGLDVRHANIGTFGSGILGLTVFGDEVEIPSYDEMYRPMILEETFGTVLISNDLMGIENIARRRCTESHEAARSAGRTVPGSKGLWRCGDLLRQPPFLRGRYLRRPQR